MTNFIVSYDLNGPTPSHREVDDHIRQIAGHYGRILETVWYVGASSQTYTSLRDYMMQILGPEDRLLVVECREAAWWNLLVTSDSLLKAWEQYRD